MKEKSPELRATLDLIMMHMKHIEEQITILAKEGYIHEKHERTLVLAMYNVGDMIANSVECGIIIQEIKRPKGEKNAGKEKPESK